MALSSYNSKFWTAYDFIHNLQMYEVAGRGAHPPVALFLHSELWALAKTSEETTDLVSLRPSGSTWPFWGTEFCKRKLQMTGLRMIKQALVEWVRFILKPGDLEGRWELVVRKPPERTSSRTQASLKLRTHGAHQHMEWQELLISHI